jgi:hypothetical protein
MMSQTGRRRHEIIKNKVSVRFRFRFQFQGNRNQIGTKLKLKLLLTVCVTPHFFLGNGYFVSIGGNMLDIVFVQSKIIKLHSLGPTRDPKK